MFIHLGGEVMVSAHSIISIIDVKNAEHAEITKEFIQSKHTDKTIVIIDANDHKSYVITDTLVYISPISSVTLKKRAEFLYEGDE